MDCCMYIKYVDKNCVDKLYDEYNLFVKNWEHSCEYMYDENECVECKNHKIEKQTLINKWLDMFDVKPVTHSKYIEEHRYSLNSSLHPKFKLVQYNNLNIATKIKELAFRLMSKTKKNPDSKNIVKILYAIDFFKNIYMSLKSDKNVQLLFMNHS